MTNYYINTNTSIFAPLFIACVESNGDWEFSYTRTGAAEFSSREEAEDYISNKLQKFKIGQSDMGWKGLVDENKIDLTIMSDDDFNTPYHYHRMSFADQKSLQTYNW